MFTFQDVIGQDRAKSQMLQTFRSGQIPHAWMLSGKEGVGKMALALAFARLVLCQESQDAEPCMNCRSCHQMDKLVHPDLHFMFPFANKGKSGHQETSDDYIHAFRELLLKSPYFSFNDLLTQVDAQGKVPIIYASDSDLIFQKLSKKSMEGGWKVVIIHLPERCNEASANKMLKLLEEPPQKTLFLLLSQEPSKLLPTILSRVQELHIPPISEEDLYRHLTEKMGISSANAASLSHMAGGSLTQLSSLMSLENDQKEHFDRFVSLMRLAYMRRLKDLKGWSEEVAAIGREKQKAFLGYCQRMIRESFMGNLKIDELLYMTPEEKGFTSRFSPFINTRNVMPLEREMELAQTHIEQNVNAKMVFFDLVLKTIILLKQN